MEDRSRSPTRIHEKIRLLARWKAAIGLPAAVRLGALRCATKLGFPEPAAWWIHPRQVLHPLRARLRGSSDMFAFDQIFILQEYSALRELQPASILDLGAYVGFSSAYFLNAFPRAHIVAVEPDSGNFAICKTNLLPYGDRVLLLNGAVWSRTTRLRLVRGAFGDGLEWATQVDERDEQTPTSTTVQAWDVRSLIDMLGANDVDLLKVDIERAELSIFGDTSESWLHRVRNICIELHGEDCERVFFAALRDFDYELRHSGELTICRNVRRRRVRRGRSTRVSSCRGAPQH